MDIRVQIPNELFCEIANYINDTSLLSKVSILSRNWYDRHQYETNRRITKLMPNWIKILNGRVGNSIFYVDCPNCPMKNKYILYKLDKLSSSNSGVISGTTCPKHTMHYLKFTKIEKKEKKDIIYTIEKSVNKSQDPHYYCKCKLQFDNMGGVYIILPFICIKYAIRDFIDEMLC